MIAMISAHSAGHAYTPDGRLVRADFINGHWVATRFTPDLRIDNEVIGSDEGVHALVNTWTKGL
ncbi:hypothetical protein QEH38_gp49 [Mycobacterium phage LilSpotty]|uniref:Uncharacterized protein n=1 Tax=Mycobacterium phage LilSpotty TaxID=2588512 RepID=A0A4Y6EQ68_9CAUD|nr:hypothetical protein QEH38_gp49 [Mycobacterium phage LilSpotty]QDF19781.1 hypothetical protein SEA_LILSPOTTY_49 [Mycobacterium phage LilSpotty]